MGNSSSKVKRPKALQVSREYVEGLVTRDWQRERETEKGYQGDIEVPKGVAILRGDLPAADQQQLLQLLACAKWPLVEILEVGCCSYRDALPSCQAASFMFPFCGHMVDGLPDGSYSDGYDLLDDCWGVPMPALSHQDQPTTGALSHQDLHTTGERPAAADSFESRRDQMLAARQAGTHVSVHTGHAWRYLAGCGYMPGRFARRMSPDHIRPAVCVLVVSDPGNCRPQNDWDGQSPVPPVEMYGFLRSELAASIPVVVCHTVGPAGIDPHFEASSSSADKIISWCAQEKLPYFRCVVGLGASQMSHRLHSYLIRLALASFLLAQLPSSV